MCSDVNQNSDGANLVDTVAHVAHVHNGMQSVEVVAWDASQLDATEAIAGGLLIGACVAQLDLVFIVDSALGMLFTNQTRIGSI